MATPRLLTRIVAPVAAAVTALALLAVPAVADDGEVRLLVTFAEPVATAELAATVPFALDSDALDSDGDASAAGEAPFTTAAVAAEPSAVQVLELDSAADAAAATALLRRRGDVVSVEEDGWLYAATDTTSADAATVGGGSWGVHNDGVWLDGRRGTAGIDVGARAAWPFATGRNVVVAVIDTGVDINHPALRDRLWVNPRANTPRFDPVTTRTYVGDVHGWNFVSSPTNPSGSAELFAHPVTDAHGTHVAGIIAGRADHTVGFEPVAPDARIMVLKFLDGDSGRVSDAIAAVRYAAANGAHVVNASWTSPNASEALRRTLLESGLPIVTAAGNSGLSLEEAPLYPAAWRLPNVVSVTAVDHAGALTGFATRSRDLVDVVAPGNQVLSTLPGNRFGRMSGTSQAAPHVTGAVALALQHHRGADPVVVANAVRASVRPLPGLRETRSGGLVRAPLLLDHLGTRVPSCEMVRPAGFLDVPATSVHAEAVDCLAHLGITAGRRDGTYGVTAGLTRGQVASMVARALERADRMPAVPTTGRFADVPTEGYVHRDAIEALASVGIVHGRTSTSFAPHRITTRAEFAATVARANEYLAGAPFRVFGSRFPDTVGHADENVLRAAAGLRLVAGRPDGTFGPDEPVRRDQAAAMLMRLLDRIGQQGLASR